MVASLVAGSAVSAADLVPFRIGEASPANTFLAIWMAADAGLYAAHGLQLEIVPDDRRKRNRGCLRRRAHRCYAYRPVVGRARQCRAVPTCALSPRSAMSSASRFSASRGSKPRMISKGGIVGISSAGSESDATITIALGQLGLKRADVTIKEIGTRRFEALQSRRGDGEARSTNPIAAAPYSSGLTALVDLAPQQIPWLFSGLVAKRPFIQSNPDVLKRFLEATIEGNRPRDRGGGPRQGRPGKGKWASMIQKSSTFPTRISRRKHRSTPKYRSRARAIIEQIAAPGASKSLDDYIDTNLGDTLKAEGFFDAAGQKKGQ